MVHALCGGYGAARLHDRIDWERARRAADRLRLQRHHRAAPGARRPRRLGHLLRPELPALHARARDELTEETKEWFHRAFQPEPLGRVFEDPEDPYVLTVGEGVAEAPLVGGCLTLLCASIGTPVRGADRRLHADGRGPQHRGVPGRHGAQPPDPRRQARQRGRVRVRHEREPEGADAARGPGVDALDRGDPRRADRAARDPRDRERARRPRQAHGDDAAGRDGPARRRREDPGSDRGGGSRDDYEERSG